MSNQSNLSFSSTQSSYALHLAYLLLKYRHLVLCFFQPDLVCASDTNNGTTSQCKGDPGGLLYGRRTSTSDLHRNQHTTAASTAASPPVQPRPQPRNGYCNKHGSAAQPAASRSGRTQQPWSKPWSKATQSLTQPISHTTTRAMVHKLATSRPQGITTFWPGQRPGPRQ